MKAFRSLCALGAVLLVASCVVTTREGAVSTASAPAAGRVFYVAGDGDDGASGLSPAAAWKSVEKVNAMTFGPGDAVLFRCGDVWKGQLHPQGSGAERRAIRLGSFGAGAMPVIDFGAATGAGVKLTNQAWWVIENLAVTSGVPPEAGVGRQGIVVTAEGNGGRTHHVTVRNCHIHDIWGQLGGTGTFTGYNSAAIFIGPSQGRGSGAGGGGRGAGRGGAATVPAPGGAGATGGAGAPRADDIVVENNRIERVDRCGIIVWHGYDHIAVRRNVMEDLGGDGIFMNGPKAGVMEYNVVKRSCMRTGDPEIAINGNYNPHSAAMWIQNATETVMQFNEAYDTGRQKGNGDGNAYDFDFTCVNCVAQYNYSRNNHGFLLIMERTQNNVARYNISENDQSHLIQTHGTIAEGNQVYNNVFYVDYGTSDIDIYMGNGEVSDAVKRGLGAHFENNIFYATGQGRFRTVYTYGSALERKFMEQVKVMPAGDFFRHNWYFGPWTNGLPNDPEAKQGDPMLVLPGSGGEGLGTLGGYRLRAGSPCAGTGRVEVNRGLRDFFGNGLRGDRGSYGVDEGAGVIGNP